MSEIKIIAKNISYMTLGMVLVRIIGFLYSIYVVRSVAVADYGQYSYTVTLVGMLALVVDFGFSQLLIREFNNPKINKKALFSTALILKLSIALFAYSILLVIAYFTPHDSFILLIYGLILFFGAIYRNMLTTFRASERLDLLNITTVLFELFMLSGGIAAIKLGYGIKGIVWVGVGLTIFASIISVMVIKRLGYKVWFGFDLKLGRYLIKEALPLCLISLLTMIFFRVDTVLLKQIKGDYAVGIYSAVYALATVFLVIPSIFFSVMYPVLSRLAVASENGFQKALDKSLKYLFIVGLPISIGGALISKSIISISYGTKYLEAQNILSVLFFFIVISYINSLIQHAVITKGGQRRLFGIVLLTAAFNILLNLFLIPKYGAMGAALTTVLSEVVLVCCQFYLFTKIGLVFNIEWRWLLGSLMAVGFLVIPVYITRGYFIMWPVILGAFTYLLSLIVFGALDRYDRSVISAIAQ